MVWMKRGCAGVGSMRLRRPEGSKGFQVGGMVCASCSEAITHALQKRPGVESVTIDHATGHAVIRHDPARVSRDAIVEVITGLGYTVAP